MSLSKYEYDDNNGSSMGRSWNGWVDGKMIDDCVGVLLSYLSLVDKFRLESVSRQWQRKIFWSVRYLRVHIKENGICFINGINDSKPSPVNVCDLKMVFKKCSNIEHVEVIREDEYNLGSQILSVIGNECQFLSHLKISYFCVTNDGALKDLFVKCGAKLRKLELDGETDLKDYPFDFVNLEELIVKKHLLTKLAKTHLKKLVLIEGYIYSSEINSKRFASFCDSYANQMKSIRIKIYGYVNKEELLRLFNQMNKFLKLKSISIWIPINEDLLENFSSCELDDLKKMNAWNNLKELIIIGGNSNANLDFNSYYQSFVYPFLCASNFNLETLELMIKPPIGGSSINKAFQICPNLKSLTLRTSGAPDGFYKDMHLRFPNLKQLYLEDSIEDKALFTQIGKNCSLNSLEILAFHERDVALTEILKQFMINYSSSALIGHNSLRIVQFNTPYITDYLTPQDIPEMIRFASQIRSTKFSFFNTSGISKCFNFDSDSVRLEVSKLLIPNNLNVFIEGKPVIMDGKMRL